MTIDTEERILKLGKDRIALSHRPVGILLLLLEHEGKVVSRERIRKMFWPNTFVEDAVISRHISLIRAALKPHIATSPIETISKHGYRYSSSNDRSLMQ